MTTTMTNSFLDLVRRSELIEDDRLGEFVTDMCTRHGGKLPEAKEKLAAALVKQELLTQWQVDKLLAGKHKGFKLGKYKLLSLLGKGGMSQVYLAEHTLMKRKVAIKVLPANRVKDSTYLERFRIEARAAAKLDHPNIVHAYDIDQDGNTHYLVMEYVEGQDLHIHVKEKGSLDYNTSADYIAQVANGLYHAHEMGLVHRDIKPANCLLDKKGTVKLLDMGLARLVGDEASLTLDNNENVLGTADYLAPEQALNSHTADPRADIYGLGCTLYFLLTSHPPFPDGTISERLLKHQVEEAPSIFNDRPDAPPALVNICKRMMAKKPDDRYQTANDVAERLSDWLADRGVDTDSGMRKSGKSSDGGVGSDVFRRFAASLERTGQPPGGGASGIGTPGSDPAASGTGSGSEMADDIGLAPIDDDIEAKRARKNKGREKDQVSAGDTIPTSSAASDTSPNTPPEGPLKSLIEEQLESGRIGQYEAEELLHSISHKEDEFNPLHPPGYVDPNSGSSPWAIFGMVFGACAFIALIWLVAQFFIPE